MLSSWVLREAVFNEIGKNTSEKKKPREIELEGIGKERDRYIDR